MTAPRQPTPEALERADRAFEELTKLFAGPIKRGRSPLSPGTRKYDLVRLPDGSVGFVRDELDAQLSAMIAEMFGEPPPEE